MTDGNDPPTPLERGLWGVLPTPFTADGSLVDVDSVTRAVAHQEGAGARGMTALGVFGEAASLSLVERAAVLRAVGGATALPVVVGFPEQEPSALLEAVERLTPELGRPPRAIMMLITSTEADQVAATAAGVHDGSGVPVVLQDFPQVTGVRIATDALLAAIQQSTGVCAVKAEGSPPCETIHAVAETTSVAAFGGLGGVGMLDDLVSGASGVMTGFAYPEALVRTLDAWDEGRFAAARAVFSDWLPLLVAEAQGPYALSIRKETLRRRGVLAHGTVRPPAATLPGYATALLDSHLAIADAEFAR